MPSGAGFQVSESLFVYRVCFLWFCLSDCTNLTHFLLASLHTTATFHMNTASTGKWWLTFRDLGSRTQILNCIPKSKRLVEPTEEWLGSGIFSKPIDVTSSAGGLA